MAFLHTGPLLAAAPCLTSPGRRPPRLPATTCPPRQPAFCVAGPISRQLLRLFVVLKHVNLNKTSILIIYIYIYRTYSMPLETQFVKSKSIQRYAQLKRLRLAMTGKCKAKKIIVGHWNISNVSERNVPPHYGTNTSVHLLSSSAC